MTPSSCGTNRSPVMGISDEVISSPILSCRRASSRLTVTLSEITQSTFWDRWSDRRRASSILLGSPSARLSPICWRFSLLTFWTGSYPLPVVCEAHTVQAGPGMLGTLGGQVDQGRSDEVGSRAICSSSSPKYRSSCSEKSRKRKSSLPQRAATRSMRQEASANPCHHASSVELPRERKA